MLLRVQLVYIHSNASITKILFLIKLIDPIFSETEEIDAGRSDGPSTSSKSAHILHLFSLAKIVFFSCLSTRESNETGGALLVWAKMPSAVRQTGKSGGEEKAGLDSIDLHWYD